VCSLVYHVITDALSVTKYVFADSICLYVFSLHYYVFYAISILILHLDVLCILVSAAKFTYIYYITDCDLTIMKLRICVGIHVHMFQSNFVSDFIYHINMSTESF